MWLIARAVVGKRAIRTLKMTQNQLSNYLWDALKMKFSSPTVISKNTINIAYNFNYAK